MGGDGACSGSPCRGTPLPRVLGPKIFGSGEIGPDLGMTWV